MREKREFGQRSTSKTKKEVRSKYLILTEGAKTEPIYFNCLAENSAELGISPLVEIVQIEKSLGEKGLSNPKLLVEYLVGKLDETDISYMYSTFINAFMDVLNDFDIFIRWSGLSQKVEEELKNYIKEILKHDLLDVVDIKDLRRVVKGFITHIRGKFGYLSTLVIKGSDIEASLSRQLVTFDRELDHLCLIVDRDKKSFKDKQYDMVLETCEHNNIELFVSNPCFELWLLLHLCDVKELDFHKLEKNKKNPETEKTYLDEELYKRMPFYQKNNYDAYKLISNIDNAIKNEKSMSEDLSELKNEAGTNIGLLIELMRKN